MLTFQTKTHVEGLSGTDVTYALMHPTDEQYRAWWPDRHLELHRLHQGEPDLPDEIYIDEYVGTRRVRLHAEVLEEVPGRRLVLQLKKGVRLPARLTLDLEDDARGVTITHTLRVGYEGAGRALDPLLRLYFSDAFAQALDEHVRAEFPRLRDLLYAAA